MTTKDAVVLPPVVLPFMVTGVYILPYIQYHTVLLLNIVIEYGGYIKISSIKKVENMHGEIQCYIVIINLIYFLQKKSCCFLHILSNLPREGGE